MNTDDLIKRTLQLMEYSKILMNHGFYDDNPNKELPKSISDFLRIIETLPMILERVTVLNKAENGLGCLDPNIREATFDSVKLLANICVFTDAMLPIVDKYNPSDEVKNELAEFIRTHPLNGNVIDDICQEMLKEDNDENN